MEVDVDAVDIDIDIDIDRSPFSLIKYRLIHHFICCENQQHIIQRNKFN